MAYLVGEGVPERFTGGGDGRVTVADDVAFSVVVVVVVVVVAAG